MLQEKTPAERFTFFIIPKAEKVSHASLVSEVNRSRLSKSAEARITRQIKSYERQLTSLKNNLSKMDANSRRGKNYVTRIERLEKRIQSLEQQLY